ncbi:MAG: hypothetical protein KBD63_06910 [Bacteriovoracaceae bacterium]|nr:hypothetical protein [Bacteriovoracaceae bacterium]
MKKHLFLMTTTILSSVSASSLPNHLIASYSGQFLPAFTSQTNFPSSVFSSMIPLDAAIPLSLSPFSSISSEIWTHFIRKLEESDYEDTLIQPIIESLKEKTKAPITVNLIIQIMSLSEFIEQNERKKLEESIPSLPAKQVSIAIKNIQSRNVPSVPRFAKDSIKILDPLFVQKEMQFPFSFNSIKRFLLAFPLDKISEKQLEKLDEVKKIEKEIHILENFIIQQKSYLASLSLMPFKDILQYNRARFSMLQKGYIAIQVAQSLLSELIADYEEKISTEETTLRPSVPTLTKSQKKRLRQKAAALRKLERKEDLDEVKKKEDLPGIEEVSELPVVEESLVLEDNEIFLLQKQTKISEWKLKVAQLRDLKRQMKKIDPISREEEASPTVSKKAIFTGIQFPRDLLISANYEDCLKYVFLIGGSVEINPDDNGVDKIYLAGQNNVAIDPIFVHPPHGSQELKKNTAAWVKKLQQGLEAASSLSKE